MIEIALGVSLVVLCICLIALGVGVISLVAWMIIELIKILLEE